MCVCVLFRNAPEEKTFAESLCAVVEPVGAAVEAVGGKIAVVVVAELEDELSVRKV